MSMINSRDDLYKELMSEFFESCEDQIDAINENIDALFQETKEPDSALADIRRAAHNLKGLGSTFGYPLISIIAHRLEDYLGDSQFLEFDDMKNAQLFIDQIKDTLKRKDQPGEDESSEIVRALPSRSSRSDSASSEIMVIMPKSVQQKLVEEELQQNGFRVTNIETSFQAIEMAVHARPDIIVASAIIDHLDGQELAHVFRAIEATRNIPLVLITSFKDDDEMGPKDLPENCTLIHKGPGFMNDFTTGIKQLIKQKENA